jgi:DNA-binding transcriptional ArsR family regulator
MPPELEAIAEQVFTALADPSRRAILAALASGGPATATDLAGRLPITRQAIAKHLALLAEAGLVTAEPGERRRVRYRLRSAPMQVAQQFLAALARDWDGPLGALKDHLDRGAHEPSATRSAKAEHIMADHGFPAALAGSELEGGHHNEDSSDRHAGRMGGSAPGAAREGESANPRQGRAGR